MNQGSLKSMIKFKVFAHAESNNNNAIKNEAMNIPQETGVITHDSFIYKPGMSIFHQLERFPNGVSIITIFSPGPNLNKVDWES